MEEKEKPGKTQEFQTKKQGAEERLTSPQVEKENARKSEEFQKKAKEAEAWLSSPEGEQKFKDNFKEAKKLTAELDEKRQVSSAKLEEVITI